MLFVQSLQRLLIYFWQVFSLEYFKYAFINYGHSSWRHVSRQVCVCVYLYKVVARDDQRWFEKRFLQCKLVMSWSKEAVFQQSILYIQFFFILLFLCAAVVPRRREPNRWTVKFGLWRFEVRRFFRHLANRGSA